MSTSSPRESLARWSLSLVGICSLVGVISQITIAPVNALEDLEPFRIAMLSGPFSMAILNGIEGIFPSVIFCAIVVFPVWLRLRLERSAVATVLGVYSFFHVSILWFLNLIVLAGVYV